MMMNHRLGAKAKTALVLLCLSWNADTSWAEDRALLIGIGNYQVEAANLPGVAEDLAMMREVALTLGFADSQIKELTNSEATLRGIRSAITDWLVEGTTASDRVLFYHSGHGTRVPDLSRDENDGSDEALLPYDFVETPVAGGEKRLSNILLDDELGRLLERIPAREVVALVDSCHSGTMTRSLGGVWTSKFYNYQGIPKPPRAPVAYRSLGRDGSIVLLSAAQPEEEAQTSKLGALFTQGIFSAVRDAAPRQQLTLEQLKSATASYIRQGVGSRKELIHRPMLTGHQSLRSINLFLPPSEPTVAGGAAAGELWTQLETLVQDAGQALGVSASKSLYRVGESLELSVIAPDDGYLHILNVGGGEDELIVLFPNRYQTDNLVRRGQTVRIPSATANIRTDFRLPASLPRGHAKQENLVVAIQTRQPLFLEGQAPASQTLSRAEELFRVIRRGELMRSISRQPLRADTYSAGQVVVTIGQ